MARKQDAYYFDNFVACAEESCHAAHLLRKVLGEFHPDNLQKYLEEIHEIENRADGKKHDMLDKLAKEFIPPIGDDRRSDPLLRESPGSSESIL